MNLIIHALIIADDNGRFLVDVIRNEKLEATRLSALIGALKIFGEETLGKIKDIRINGLGINMLVVSKYNLIMIAIMDEDLPETNFREGCESALDTFYDSYKEVLQNWKGNLRLFSDFKILLNQQIQNYIEALKSFIYGSNETHDTFGKLMKDMDSYNKRFFKKRGDSL